VQVYLRPIFGLLIVLMPAAHAACGDAPVAPAEPKPYQHALGPLTLDDVPEKFIPPHPRTEADKDRLEALALFATGRTLERQQRYAEALRFYQRAFRHDPQASAILHAIIHMADRLKRHSEALRYALKAVETDEANPKLLRRLGGYLTGKGDWKGALELYEKALAARAGEKETTVDILYRMEMGRLYYLVDESAKAADCFARVIYALDHPKEFGLDEDFEKKVLTEPDRAYSLFGECFLQADRFDEATAAFEKSHELKPNKWLLLLHRAQVLSRRDKPAEALKCLQACFAEGVDDEGVSPYQLLAGVLEKLGRSEELIERLEKLWTDNPNNLPLAAYLAAQYLKAENYAKAEPLYLTLSKKKPTLSGYRSLLQIYRQTNRPDELLKTLGEAAQAAGTLDALDTEFEKIVSDEKLVRTLIDNARKQFKADPDGFGFGMRLAVGLLALETEQFDTAAEFFDLAIKADPEQAADLRLTWGLRLILEERATEAAGIFQQAIDDKLLPDDNSIFYFYLAGALAIDKQTDKALAAAKKAIDLSAAAARNAADEAITARETAQKKPDDQEAAEKALRAAQTADRKKANSIRFRSRDAWIRFHAKRYGEATEAYAKLLEDFDADRQPPEVREILRDARLALSNLCVLQDDLPKAEEWLEEVLNEFPDDIGASNDLGYLWADQGKNLQRALKMIQRAVDAEPDNVAYRDSLGWVYYRLGKHKEAVAELEKAVKQTEKNDEEPDGVILDHLGDAYLKVKQIDKAKDAWRRAVEAFKKQEEPDKAKAVEEKMKKH